jgi:hypothetical protein
MVKNNIDEGKSGVLCLVVKYMFPYFIHYGVNTMKRIFFALSLCIMLPGCAAYQQNSKYEPTQLKTVAVLPFTSVSVGSAGQEAADQLALKLMANSFVVIDRSRTTAVVSETKFYGSGLSDEVRNALQAQNITAVAFGSVNEYGCEPKKNVTFTGNLVPKKRCTVSLTAKIADIATGRLLWGMTSTDSAEKENSTAAELMSCLMRKADFSGIVPAASPVEKKEVPAAPVTPAVPAAPVTPAAPAK